MFFTFFFLQSYNITSSYSQNKNSLLLEKIYVSSPVIINTYNIGEISIRKKKKNRFSSSLLFFYSFSFLSNTININN